MSPDPTGFPDDGIYSSCPCFKEHMYASRIPYEMHSAAQAVCNTVCPVLTRNSVLRSRQHDRRRRTLRARWLSRMIAKATYQARCCRCKWQSGPEGDCGVGHIVGVTRGNARCRGIQLSGHSQGRPPIANSYKTVSYKVKYKCACHFGYRSAPRRAGSHPLLPGRHPHTSSQHR